MVILLLIFKGILLISLMATLIFISTKLEEDFTFLQILAPVSFWDELFWQVWSGISLVFS